MSETPFYGCAGLWMKWPLHCASKEMRQLDGGWIRQVPVMPLEHKEHAKILRLERWKRTICRDLKHSLTCLLSIFKTEVERLTFVLHEEWVHFLWKQGQFTWAEAAWKAQSSVQQWMYVHTYSAVCSPSSRNAGWVLAASQILVIGRSLWSFLLHSGGWRFMLKNSSARVWHGRVCLAVPWRWEKSAYLENLLLLSSCWCS